MKEFIESLKVVVLHSPCDHFYEQTVSDIFGRIVDAKRKGYLKEYPHNILPIDTTDFFSTHIAICEEVSGSLNPICVYKSVSHRQCEKFGVAFPPLVLAEKGGNVECYENIKNILKKKSNAIGEVIYDCSWTVDPSLRKSEKSIFLRELAMSLVCSYHKSYKILGGFASATLRMKTDRVFYKMGYKQLGNSPFYDHPFLSSDRAVMVYIDEFSDWITFQAKRFSTFWNERITLGNSVVESSFRKTG